MPPVCAAVWHISHVYSIIRAAFRRVPREDLPAAFFYQKAQPDERAEPASTGKPDFSAVRALSRFKRFYQSFYRYFFAC